MSSAVLQKAILAALDGVISVGVYDFPPDDTLGDCVTIGDFTRTESGTKTEDIVEHVAQINTWSSGRSFAAVGLIQAEIRDALHRQKLSPDAGTWVHCFETYCDVIPEGDGELHGVQRFTILYQY